MYVTTRTLPSAAARVSGSILAHRQSPTHTSIQLYGALALHYNLGPRTSPCRKTIASRICSALHSFTVISSVSKYSPCPISPWPRSSTKTVTAGTRPFVSLDQIYRNPSSNRHHVNHHLSLLHTSAVRCKRCNQPMCPPVSSNQCFACSAAIQLHYCRARLPFKGDSRPIFATNLYLIK